MRICIIFGTNYGNIYYCDLNFSEKRVKYEITPNVERDTVFFRQNITYTFVPELSIGPETDTVDVLNAPLLVTHIFLQFGTDFQKYYDQNCIPGSGHDFVHDPREISPLAAPIFHGVVDGPLKWGKVHSKSRLSSRHRFRRATQLHLRHYSRPGGINPGRLCHASPRVAERGGTRMAVCAVCECKLVQKYFVIFMKKLTKWAKLWGKNAEN